MDYILWLILPIALLLGANVYFSYEMFENSKELNKSRIKDEVENEEISKIYFPSSLVKMSSSKKSSPLVYGWMTEECRGCREMIEELKNNSLSNGDEYSNLTIFYHGNTEVFDKLKTAIDVIDVRELISKEEMGKMLKYSPIFFTLDEKNRVIQTSFSPSEYI